MPAKPKTTMLFRVDKRGEVVAIMPECKANRGYYVCYAHVGQHSECSEEWYKTTRPATHAESRDLYYELVCIGYAPKTVSRITAAMVRKQA